MSPATAPAIDHRPARPVSPVIASPFVCADGAITWPVDRVDSRQSVTILTRAATQRGSGTSHRNSYTPHAVAADVEHVLTRRHGVAAFNARKQVLTGDNLPFESAVDLAAVGSL